jgi:hypothetical protein
MSVVNEVETAVVFVATDDDLNWEHTVHKAIVDQGGSFDPLNSASRMRLIETIRQRGYPNAVLDHDPSADESLTRLYIRPHRRTQRTPGMA